MRLDAFLPQDRRAALGRGVGLPDRTMGAALFADLSGFTALTERLVVSFGPMRGAEELSRLLGVVYEDLIGEVEKYGGSVIGFAGDAITCWFDGDDGVAAASAAQGMQRVTAARGGHPLPDGGRASLRVKAALAVGPVRRFAVGDPEVQRIDVIAGRTLEALAAAEHAASPDDVVLALGAAPAAVPIVEVRTSTEDGRRVGLVDPAWQPVAATGRPPPPAVPWLADELAAPWVLPTVRQRLLAGVGDFLAGFRPAAALFQSFRGIDFDADPEAGDKLDRYIRWVQRVVAQAEGTLVQLTIGDKGSYLYAAFGAPTAHDDDAVRAVAVARELRQPPLPFVTEIRTGVSYGQMFAGTYGSERRCTYGVLGPRTNLAARLMGRAEVGEVLCGSDVVRQAARVWRFEPRGEITVKGIATPVQVAVPVADVVSQRGPAAAPAGRTAERRRLDDSLARVVAGRSAALTVVGEAGSGKSRMLAYLADHALASGATVLSGSGQRVARTTAYRAWRSVLRGALELAPEAAPEQLTGALGRLEPALLPRADLLADILWPEHVPPEREGVDRKPLVIGAALAVLRSVLRRGPLVLLIDDAQWLDSLSQEVSEAVEHELVRTEPALLFVRARRPAEAGAPAAAEVLELGPMPAGETLAMAAQHLGVAEAAVPAPLFDLLRERSGGNPFLIEALLDHMLDQRMLRLTTSGAGVRSVDAFEGSVAAESVPATVQGLVLSRLDCLVPQAQLSLKTGAVIGREFTLPPLSDTLQSVVGFDGPTVRLHVADLAAEGFIDPEEGERQFRFRQALTQEVAYATLLFAQRRAFHHHLAGWYRSHPGAELARVAHHAYYAALGATEEERILAAADDLQRLADHLLVLGAYQDVVHTCRRALGLLADDPRWGARRAHLLVRLGVVQEHLSVYEEARASLEAALEEGGRSGAEVTVTDALNALCMVATRRGAFDEAERHALEALRHASAGQYPAGTARARSRLGILAAYRGDHDQAAEHYEAAMVLAEELGDLVSLASCLSNLGLVRIYQQRPDAARPLLQRAMEVANQLQSRHLWARFVTNLGLADEHLGELDAAEEHYRAGLVIFEELGARQEALVNILNLGELAMRRGRPDEARPAYRRALEEGLALGALPVALSAVGGLAWAAVEEGRPQHAAELLGLALGHPARDAEVEQHADMVLAKIRPLLLADELAAYLERGRAASLEDVARREVASV